MIKLCLFVITTLEVLFQYVDASKYKCTFGPDITGAYIEDIVETKVALACGSFCTCVGLKNNTCHFGPDEEGNYVTKSVSSE